MKSLKRIYIIFAGLIVLVNTAFGIIHLCFKDYAEACTWLIVVNYWVIQYYILSFKHTEGETK